MSKDLSAKYYQDNNRRLEKTHKRCKNFSKEEKEKKAIMWS